jgi:two-component system, cell cycle sensor histidine kinase and response regulator CckA
VFNNEKAALKPILVIISIYLVSLLAFAALITLDRSDSVAIFLTYLLVFGVACIVNFFVLSSAYSKLNSEKKAAQLYWDVANIYGEILAIVDKNLNCIDIPNKNPEYQTFGDVLFSIGVSESDAKVLESYIKSPHIINKHNIRSDYQSITLSCIERDAVVYDLIIKEYKKFQDLYCIKLRKRSHHSIIEMLGNIGIASFELDEIGVIKDVNSHFKALLGSKLPNNSTKDILMSEVIDGYEVDLRQSYFQKVVKIAGQKIRYMLITYLYEYDSRRVIIGSIFPLSDVNVHDISNDFEEFCLKYSWDTFFQNSPYPVCILSSDRVIRKANAAFIKTLDLNEDFTATEFQSIFKLDDSEKIMKKIDDMVLSNSYTSNIEQVKLLNGDRILEVFIGSIFDFDGNLYGFIARLQDITQHRQLEDSLSHAQRMQTIGQLAGSIAHDFNNILTAISGFSDLLLLRHGMGDPSFSNIMQIKQSADRASSLVKRLLAFSRKQTLQLQSISPIDLFSEFNPLIQRLIGTRIKLVQHIDHEVWDIKVDLVQMEQVILNLVVNAHHAMGDHGTLQINVENYIVDKTTKFKGFMTPTGEQMPSLGEYVKISVEDTGSGISEKDIHKIFEPFFSTKLDVSGTGLGLATVYGVVRQSNAFIFVKSKVGHGTEFMLLFPKAEKEMRSNKVISVQNVESDLGGVVVSDTIGTGTILLVEDEDAIRLFAKNVLENKGYNVIDFPLAKDAFDSLSQNPVHFDLLVTDVIMPEMTGPALVKKLQETRPNMKVIFISGYAEEAFSEEYGDKRDFNFLPKPFSLKQLLVTVKEVLELKNDRDAA